MLAKEQAPSFTDQQVLEMFIATKPKQRLRFLRNCDVLVQSPETLYPQFLPHLTLEILVVQMREKVFAHQQYTKRQILIDDIIAAITSVEDFLALPVIPYVEKVLVSPGMLLLSMEHVKQLAAAIMAVVKTPADLNSIIEVIHPQARAKVAFVLYMEGFELFDKFLPNLVQS